ncbi:MAG TPA: LD-carboxypeptidase [Thermoanaerobaculia bacterium]|nr:LD-carboxypeptidase [Thermoanaerobaculia bacterium]
MKSPPRLPLLTPRPLPPGGTIAVLAISSPSKADRIEHAASILERKGFQVRIAPNAYEVERSYLAGPDDLRLRAINEAFRDPAIDAIMFARGGYGAMRILDRIDYAALAENPRPVIGYSDLTALHQAVARETGLSTFHGPMLNFDIHGGLSPEIERWFFAMLSGEAPMRWELTPDQIAVEGMAEGVLFGGCLSLTAALLDTPYDFWVDDGIWFWEEVDERNYRLDRMLTTLRLSGRLRAIRGVMIGRLKDCGNDPELEVLIHEYFTGSGIPVLRNLPFGHHGDNLLLPVGARVRIDTSARTVEFPDPLVGPRIPS